MSMGGYRVSEACGRPGSTRIWGSGSGCLLGLKRPKPKPQMMGSEMRGTLL